jgi:hypothetical protein
MALFVSACTGSKRAGDPTPTPTSGKPSVADLIDGGIVVVNSESDLEGVKAGSITLIRSQAERLLAEVQDHGGVLGAELDVLAPLPEGAPPMSYFVAAWISQKGSPGAKTAARWMGDQDWTHAPDVVFPMAVVALFSADALQHIDRELPPASSATPESAALAVGASIVPAAFVQSPADGPCTTVTEFLGRTLTAVFDALRISPSTFNGLPPILSATAGFLAGLWNTAVSFAEGVVQGLVKTLTAPIVEALKVGLGALSVATIVVSYLKTWTLTVDLDPRVVDTDTYRFAVDGEPDITGTFVATAPQLADEWPPAIKDCAQVTGVKLPQLLAPGLEATWTVEQNDGVITVDKLVVPVEQDRTIHLSFKTGRETSEAAEGEPAFGSAIVRVQAPRKEFQDFFDLARNQLNSVRDQLLNKIPSAEVRNLAKAQIDAIVEPVAKQLQSDVADALGGMVTLAGTGVVIVKYHQPPEPSSSPTPPSAPPSAPPSGDAKGDFCKQYIDLYQWSSVHFEEDGSEYEILRRWKQMRPLAPANLGGDVDLQIAYDEAFIASDFIRLAQLAQQVGAAGLRINAYCGVKETPPWQR